MEFTTPYVYIDLVKVENNIKQMMDRLNQAGIEHWPHIKTHKATQLAKKQLELGAKGITAAKISEAEVMVEAGITDILIAFPIIGEEKLERLGHLIERASVRTIVDSYVVALGLSRLGEKLNRKIEVLIEIDSGSHRGGVQPGQATIDFAKAISALPEIEVIGVFTYVGQIYGLPSIAERKEEAKREADLLIQAQKELNENGFNIRVTSGGSTPSSFYSEQLAGISQSRAGNYIFGDMNAVNLGIYTQDQCALRICSTIVSTPLPGYATIDAGSKTLTSDLSIAGETYGYVCNMPGVQIVKLNEEHGYLRYDPEQYDLKIGDKIEIIPNHSCVVPNLNDYVYSYTNGNPTGKIAVDARGKNY